MKRFEITYYCGKSQAPRSYIALGKSKQELLNFIDEKHMIEMQPYKKRNG